jgi:uncharacterized protein YfaS (alpha-2-macroglobulin family)
MGKGMGTAFASRALVRWLGIAVVVAGAATGAQAARIAGVTPQGEVAQVRQVMVRFSEAVVALGDPNRPPPMTLECSGPAPERTARWVNEKEWAIDFRSPLPPGVRCTLKRAAGWSPLQGTLDGPTDFSFSTGGPAIERSEPWDGATVSEDQHFLLRLNGAATPASVTANTWCEIDGIGERIPVQIVTGAARDELLKSRRITKAADAERTLLLACTRPLPPAAKLRVVWGAGIAAAADPKVVTRTPQRLRFEVRPRFTAEFSCERERAQAPCMPLGHAGVSFSAPVPRELLAKLRLEPAGVAGAKPIAPKLQDNETQATEARFPSPLPESVAMKLTLPADLKDVDGRPLANAGSFPLTLSTGPMPPLAKFAAFPFGIIEHGPESMLPVTLRHVQGELRTGAVRVKTIAPKDWLGWMGKLAKAQDNEMKSRESALLAQQPDVRRMDLPQLVGGDPRPFEVIGIPLAEPGYHVVEIESKVLGERLLESRAPMFVRTGVLVTNLGVHFKRGHENSLVWVTTLDRAQPVPQADVALHDCRGKPLWQGRTDAQGRALVPLALPDVNGEEDCTWQGGYYVTAARQLQQQGRTVQDRAFVFSNWNRGIEPWRFNMVSSLYDEVRGQEKLRVHTIFDRTLLRAGETVSMKHLVRQESGAGLKDAEKSQLPTEMRIVHVGSGDEFKQPIQFDAAGRASVATWSVPPAAKLGLYDVQLKNAQHEWTSGRFRVEEFRLPVVDAKLMPPRGTLIAPSEAVLALQLNYLSGGGVARAPARASALLREREPSFPAYDSFSFRAPREDRGQRPDDEEGSSADGAKLVVDKQAVTTDAAGAATITLKGLPPSKRPAELHAEVSFNDPNGEVQTVSQRLPIWPAARVVGIRTGSWAAALGKVKFQAVLLDLNGKPLADGKVAVHARVTQWQANRKRLVGGFYAYDQSSVQKDLGAVCDGKTDARGLLLCEASIDAAGEVELVARAADEAGRVTEAATTVYVTRQGEFWFEQDNDDRIDILADKANYQPGDIAKLQVRMPYRQATALLSIEREGVIDTRVVTLQGDDPVIEITIPNRDAKAVKNGAAADATTWAPNVYASVLVVRGRVRHVPWYSFFNWGWKSPGEWWRAFRYEGREYQAPTAMVDLAKPSHKFGAVQLKVGLDAHRLDVKVTPDKTQYAVRQKVVTKVQVLQAGQPAAGAEIAFAAVDEALLALSDNSSWKVLEEMFPPRGWAVETSTAQGEIIGRRHYGRKALPAGGGGGRNPTRELFDTLLLWRGSVVLDAKGEATIEVPLNDSLTSFRLVALATAGADRFGTGSATVKVTQDLQMLPGLPPLAREGDQYDAIYTLRNTTGREMKVEAALAANAQRDDGAGGITRTPITFAPQAVTLPAGGAAEVKWPLQVPAGVFSLAFEASVRQAGGAAGPGDTVKTTQLVKPAVPQRIWAATLQQLDGPLQLPVAPPADALPADPAKPDGPRAGGVIIGLQPTLASALPGVRRYFETYPYTCLEQQTSRALALKDTAAWTRIGNALPGYLDSDGLALYYPPRDGDPPRGSDRLTAYVIAAAHEAQQPIPEAPRERMLTALTAFVEGRITRAGWAPSVAAGTDLDVRKLAAVEALSRHGRAAPKHLQSITLEPNRWPTAAVIDWLRILQRIEGVPDRAQRMAEAQTLLRTRITYAGTVLKFSTEESDFWWWLMDSGDANAARLILAVVDDPAWKDEVPRMVLGALARQQRGAWLTTTANLWSVFALERFAARFENQPVAGRSVLALGPASAAHDWTAQQAGGRLTLPWPVASGATPLQAQQQGSGKPWLAVQTLAAVPLKAPIAAGYRLTRSISAVERKTPDAWTRGDVLRVKLEIEAQADMTWVAMSDPVPTGASLLGTGLGRDSAIATSGERREGTAWLAYEERAQEAFRATWGFMPRGRHVIEYTLRLNSAGRFHLPPSRIESMYAPESFGELPNATLEVRP